LVLSNFAQQSIDVILREIFPAPLLIIEWFTGTQGEKAQRIHWAQTVAQRLNGLPAQSLTSLKYATGRDRGSFNVWETREHLDDSISLAIGPFQTFQSFQEASFKGSTVQTSKSGCQGQR
jgi:hypothetical protein